MLISEILLNFLIYLNIYWYLAPVAIIPAGYYVFVKIFAFPLASNKIHEFVIFAKPEKLIVKKVSARYIPFFIWKKGIYWFGKPAQDVNSLNRFHFFLEGLNQELTQQIRRDGKINDILANRGKHKQITNHTIRLPLKLKAHLHRHYTITLDPQSNLCQITKASSPQSFKLNLWHSVGLVMQHEVEKTVESENNSGIQLAALTTESVIQQIQYVQEFSYYSSSYAFNLFQKIRNTERNFITWLSGSIDPKIILLIVILGGAVAAIYFGMNGLKPTLPPMPTG